jgi:hypothetical protein
LLLIVTLPLLGSVMGGENAVRLLDGAFSITSLDFARDDKAWRKSWFDDAKRQEMF